jgi:ATP-dependent Clp protease ATP-binding subunit ClpC
MLCLVFDRFTKPARDVVVNAQREARALGHSYIGTEHQLLGLLADRRSGASRVLKSFGVTAKRVRKQLVQIVKPGETPVEGSLPFTAAAKQVHELAFMEAKSSGSDVTPEHLLLGLVREREGVATQVLLGLGADPNAIGTALMSFLRGPSQPGSPIPRARRLRLRWSRLTR